MKNISLLQALKQRILCLRTSLDVTQPVPTNVAGACRRVINESFYENRTQQHFVILRQAQDDIGGRTKMKNNSLCKHFSGESFV